MNSYKPFNDIWKFYSDFVCRTFKRIWPDNNCVLVATVSVYKDFQLFQKVLKAHSTYYHEGA